MNIQQAIMIANGSDKNITRTGEPWSKGFLKLKFDSRIENCLFKLCDSNDNKCGRAWKPQLNDLLASDWLVCD